MTVEAFGKAALVLVVEDWCPSWKVQSKEDRRLVKWRQPRVYAGRAVRLTQATQGPSARSAVWLELNSPGSSQAAHGPVVINLRVKDLVPCGESRCPVLQ